MRLLFKRYIFLYIIVCLLTVGGSWFWYQQLSIKEGVAAETAVVAEDEVVQSVTVSGKTEATNIARLGFAVSGTIADVYRSVGDEVVAGDVIASLENQALLAEYTVALERVRFYEAQKKELIRGAIEQERSVARSNVKVAEAALATVQVEYAEAVKKARQALLSTGLVAYPLDDTNDDVAPVISGSYLCDEEGSYTISLFRSAADSNISYHLTGLATGTYAANVVTPASLGDCGLYIQFDENETYRSSEWQVIIPNKRGASYVSLKAAYDMLLAQQDAAVAAALEELSLARKAEQVVTAPAQAEAVAQIDASIAQAVTQLSVQEAKIADYTIRAPYDGVVSMVDMKVGEPVGPEHTVTFIQEGEYKLTARVPEVDITKVSVGDAARIFFDAEPDLPLAGVVSYVSPVSTNVAGVSYYDTSIVFAESPGWLREGLNADVVIESERKDAALTLPKRFLVTRDTATYVLQLNGEELVEVPVEIGLEGTDGTVEIIGLPAGTEVYLP